MKLGRTNNNELLYLTTDDFEIVIKDESGGAAPPFIVPGTRGSGVTVWCSSTVRELAICGLEIDEVEEDVFANAPLPIALTCDPTFFEQRNYSLYVEVRGENSSDRKLEFGHENVSLRKCITPLGHYESRLSGNLNLSNDIGMSDLIFKLDGLEYLRITVEVYPSKIDYRKDYQVILADVTAEVYNLAFDAFRRTYESYSLNGKSNSSLIEFFAIMGTLRRADVDCQGWRMERHCVAYSKNT